MKLEIILLIAFSGILLGSSLQHADSQLIPNDTYLLQGNGFSVTEDSIDNSALDLQFSTGKLVNNRIKLTLQDGVISFGNIDYIASTGWTGMMLNQGRFLSLSGNAENIDGDKISLSLLGRLVQNSKDGSVYSVTGKITKDDESTKLVYSVKVSGSGTVTTKQETTKEKTIQVNILSGASNIQNIKYYSLPTIEITTGTSVVWKNDDSVPHRIMSGIASFSHGKPFKPDGKIDSGNILPGQTFKVIINQTGVTRFFDSTYSWMDGVIITHPDSKSFSTKTKENAFDKYNYGK